MAFDEAVTACFRSREPGKLIVLSQRSGPSAGRGHGRPYDYDEHTSLTCGDHSWRSSNEKIPSLRLLAKVPEAFGRRDLFQN